MPLRQRSRLSFMGGAGNADGQSPLHKMLSGALIDKTEATTTAKTPAVAAPSPSTIFSSARRARRLRAWQTPQEARDVTQRAVKQLFIPPPSSPDAPAAPTSPPHTHIPSTPDDFAQQRKARGSAWRAGLRRRYERGLRMYNLNKRLGKGDANAGPPQKPQL